MLEIECDMRLHVCHVVGTRMIDQGTDSLSRRDLLEGVILGEIMLSFIPLSKGVVEIQPEFLDWIKTWSSYENLRLLEPEEWFVEAHDIIGYSLNGDIVNIPLLKSGFGVWPSPVAAVDVAVEGLRRARHKRQSCIPRG